VDESVDELETRMSALRAAVRQAVAAGDSRRAGALRRDLRHAEREWEAALDAAAGQLPPWPRPAARVPDDPVPDDAPHAAGPASGPLLPLREQVHEALSLLRVPAAPRLIATVHEAFFATTFPTSRLTSLRRDEERSFSSAPFARPYYICAALSADYLSPSRGLLAISTWPMERRIIGSQSPRVDFLISAVNVAQAIEQIPDPVPAAKELLARFAASTRGSSVSPLSRIDPRAVIRAAQAELEVIRADDASARAQAARRAREQLDDVEQLFGAASFREAKRKAPREG
jgi:hypothetical protein